MMNPFNDNDIENAGDTDKFIPNSIYTRHRIEKNQPIYMYILIGMIYIMEIFTSILGGVNDSNTIGLNHSALTIQYCLMIAGIYNMSGLILTYQFNLRTYKNKLLLLFYEFIKCIWLIIGFIILFGYNSVKENSFILGYALFYILFEIIWMCNNISQIVKLKKYENDIY